MVDQTDATANAGNPAQTTAQATVAPAAGAAPAAPAAPPPLPAGSATGGHTPAFEYENRDMSEKFNLRPLPGFRGSIPEDQRKISQDVYEARNVLKLLKDDKAISATLFEEFIQRITQAGFAGCVADNVDPTLAGEALEQIRADIVRRAGTPLVYRYLRALALWALVGSILGLATIHFGAGYWPVLKGYGCVLIGAMAGAWFSIAASRWQIAFDTIPDYPDFHLEPVIRMLFVAMVAAAFALFLHLAIITVKIGNVDLASFTDSISVALLVGFIAGISQRALSVQLIDRAQKVLNPAP
jgi:hypothetical protein